mmetsp:Transcript_8166/g.21083  ORF Transcript_8166/g.21083 Transcript_8166/m.21083 type:complete len:162 (+) Transcript_8166:199-684(+)
MRHAVPSRRAESRQLRGACVDSIRAAASAVFLRRSTPYAPPRSPGGGIRADTVVEVDDFAQRFEVKIIVQHKEDWDEEKDPDGYTLKGEIPSAAAEETAVAAENGARGKRPLEEAEEGGGTSKRARTASAAEEEADEAAVVVEDEDGAIVLDDDDEDVICL